MKTYWSKYYDEDDKRWMFCIWRQNEANEIFDAVHFPIGV